MRITLDILIKRHCPNAIQESTNSDIDKKVYHDEEVMECLAQLTHVRLDRENVTSIDNMELLGTRVSNLYLQQNNITKIENLECLQSLCFLTLSGNQIAQIENLLGLHYLLLLDLSDNVIESFDEKQLPISLVFLDLHGNTCTNDDNYLVKLKSRLINLKQLDGKELLESDDDDDSDSDEGATGVITDQEIEAEEAAVRNGNLHSINEAPDPTKAIGIFKDVTQPMLERSQKRVEEQFHHHQQIQHEVELVRAATPRP